MFSSSKKQSDYQAYRPPSQVHSAPSPRVPILAGAALIAAAILLSTVITAVGTRFLGIEGPNEETVWLIDRLTGSVYKCQAEGRGKAACDPELATGSIAAQGKR